MRLSALLLFFCLIHADISRANTEDFAACLDRLSQLAREQQLPEKIIREVLGQLEYQPRVVALDRQQPEAVQTFAEYYQNRVTPNRITQGRKRYVQHQKLLSKLTRQYGVPGHYLIALWGMETNFGSYLGRMPTLDSLATLACDERRSRFFTNELFSALTLLQREQFSRDQLQGSWAGAVGHVQFMPSTYYHHAVDGDDDGRIDLWGSLEDALASAANYLQQLGWRTGERWGRQVKLPADFDYRQADMKNIRPLSYWHDLDVRRADQRPLPDLPLPAALIAPMGHSGPAFLIYPNFEVIMRWNRSPSYALSVGLLADSIVGGSRLSAAQFRPTPTLSRQLIEQLQSKLNEKGFSAGTADGIMGPATRRALREFQSSVGLTADGFPDSNTLAALKLKEVDD